MCTFNFNDHRQVVIESSLKMWGCVFSLITITKKAIKTVMKFFLRNVAEMAIHMFEYNRCTWLMRSYLHVMLVEQTTRECA